MGNLVMIATAVLAIAIPVSAYAETGYSADLDGSQEVGPNASPATGHATVVLNNAQDMIHVHLEFSGLLGPQTGAHIHGAATAGVNAGVQIALPNGSPIDVDLAITAAQVTMLQGGLMYINVHSTEFPGGEIRGQLSADPTPVEPATWGRLKALFE
jgi:hypothetical protein